jgi:RNA polymerase sigma-70 factor (ECF subfamily)
VQLTVSKRIDDYLARRPMPFPLWVRKTALDRLADLRRHHLRRRRTAEAELNLAPKTSLALAQSMIAPQRSPSQQLLAEETLREVNLALAELPEADREILLMRQLEGTQFNDIALLLDIETAAARKRFGRALLKLKDVLQHRGLLE